MANRPRTPNRRTDASYSPSPPPGSSSARTDMRVANRIQNHAGRETVHGTRTPWRSCGRGQNWRLLPIGSGASSRFAGTGEHHRCAGCRRSWHGPPQAGPLPPRCRRFPARVRMFGMGNRVDNVAIGRPTWPGWPRRRGRRRWRPGFPAATGPRSRDPGKHSVAAVPGLPVARLRQCRRGRLRRRHRAGSRRHPGRRWGRAR